MSEAKHKELEAAAHTRLCQIFAEYKLSLSFAKKFQCRVNPNEPLVSHKLTDSVIYIAPHFCVDAKAAPQDDFALQTIAAFYKLNQKAKLAKRTGIGLVLGGATAVGLSWATSNRSKKAFGVGGAAMMALGSQILFKRRAQVHPLQMVCDVIYRKGNLLQLIQCWHSLIIDGSDAALQTAHILQQFLKDQGYSCVSTDPKKYPVGDMVMEAKGHLISKLGSVGFLAVHIGNPGQDSLLYYSIDSFGAAVRVSTTYRF